MMGWPGHGCLTIESPGHESGPQNTALTMVLLIAPHPCSLGLLTWTLHVAPEWLSWAGEQLLLSLHLCLPHSAQAGLLLTEEAEG